MEEEGQKAEDENEVKKLLFRFSGIPCIVFQERGVQDFIDFIKVCKCEIFFAFFPNMTLSI